MRDLEVVVDGLACLLGQLKPNWSPGLSLTHRRSINCITIGSDIIDRNRDYVAASQFTVDGKIEHRHARSRSGASERIMPSTACATTATTFSPCSHPLPSAFADRPYAVGEQHQRNRRGQSERRPSNERARIAGTKETHRNTNLATGRAGEELRQRDQIGIRLFVEPFAVLDEFGTEIAEMRSARRRTSVQGGEKRGIPRPNLNVAAALTVKPFHFPNTSDFRMTFSEGTGLRDLNKSTTNIPSACSIANIAQNDAIILLHDKNLCWMKFS